MAPRTRPPVRGVHLLTEDPAPDAVSPADPAPPVNPPYRPAPVNASVPVPCRLPGYEGVTVIFCISRPQAALSVAWAAPGYWDTAALRVLEIRDWPFDPALVPCPHGGDAASFRAAGEDFVRWCALEGGAEALQATLSKP